MFFKYGAITLFGSSFQKDSSKQTSPRFSPSASIPVHQKYSRRYPLMTPRLKCRGLSSSLFARRYLGNKSFSLFLRLLRCFTSPSSPSDQDRSDPDLSGSGYPIWKSPVQRLLSASPRLIAATPRPSSPQHPKASTIHPYN